jgi:hypothetical protein
MSSAQEDNRKSKGERAPAAAPASNEVTSIEADLAGGNLDKIRNILFGAQSREMERRFAKIEESLARETSDIRDELRSRFDKLEAQIRNEMERLGDRLRAEENERSVAVRDLGNQLKDASKAQTEKLKGEHTERVEALNELTGELRNTASAIERRIGALDDQTGKADRELRDQLGETSRRLSDDLRNKSEEIWAALAKAVQELRNDKADRGALSALLTEVAMRLNDEFKLPSGE